MFLTIYVHIGRFSGRKFIITVTVGSLSGSAGRDHFLNAVLKKWY